MKTKLLTTLLLTTFFLTACGSNKTTTNQSSQDTTTTTTGTTDTSTGGETTDTSSESSDKEEGIELEQVFEDIVYESKGAVDEESFPSGGVGSFNNNVLTLSNLTGGDTISFNVDVSNNSSTQFMYRRTFKVFDDSGLFGLLNIELDNEPIILGNTSYVRKTAAWTGEYYSLTISLPEGFKDYVKTRSCKIEIGYETQTSLDGYYKYSVSGDGYSNFSSAVDVCNNGSTLSLNENVLINESSGPKGCSVTFPSTATNLTIEGNGNSIRMGGTYSSNANPNTGSGSPAGFTYSNVYGTSRVAEGTTMAIKNVNFYNEKSYDTIPYPERVVSYMYFFAENTVFENCTFYNGVVIFGNVKFVNCTFKVDKTNMYNVFVDHEKVENTTTTVEAIGCNFVAETSAYGDFKTAGEIGATINLKLENNLFKNDTSKSAVYINGKTYVTARGNHYCGISEKGAIVSKGTECTLNGDTMTAGQSYEM